MNDYKVLVTFKSLYPHSAPSPDYFYPHISARNKKIAITKVKLDRQRRGDEMFIKSIKVYPTKKEK